MEKLAEKRCYDGKDVEIYRNEASGLWSAYLRKEDGAYLLIHNCPSKEYVIYDLEYCELAKRNPRNHKLTEVDESAR